MIDNFIFNFVNVQRGVHPSTQFLYGDGVLSERDIVQLPAKWTRNAIPPIDGRLGSSNRLRYALSSSTQNHPSRPQKSKVKIIQKFVFFKRLKTITIALFC